MTDHPIQPSNKVGRPKSEQKRQQILHAAATLFLQEGYSGTSMDHVAKQAQVSKQTVYSHFDNKDALYRACISAKCQEYSIDPALLNDKQLTLSQLLRAVGKQLLRLFHDEQVIAMYQVVIAESRAAPHVAEVFYQTGPMQANQMLAKGLQCLSPVVLSEQESRQLAINFISLLNGNLLMHGMLNLPYRLSEAEQQQRVERSVQQFMALLELSTREAPKNRV